MLLSGPRSTSAHATIPTASVVPARGIHTWIRVSAALPHIPPVRGVTDPSLFRWHPGQRCRGHHTSAACVIGMNSLARTLWPQVRLALVSILVATGCREPTPRQSSSSSISDAVIDAIPTTTPAADPTAPCPPTIANLGEGLSHERKHLRATPATSIEPCFDVVRADLSRYQLRVLTKAQEGSSLPAPQWRDRYKLVAVTNAGMFHSQGAPVGLVIQDGVAVSSDNRKFLGYLAFDPRSPADPPAIIAGRDCPGFDLAALRTRYRSIVQSGRLLGCAGEALPWSDTKQYSAAAIGIDREGRAVFIHTRAAVHMTELAQAVTALGLVGALFLEGGPEASLVVRGTSGDLTRVGSYETNFVENDENKSFWWLPNVVALERRASAP
jgi:uncharacterized protein YigE (DUF2233 family)